MLTFCSFVNKRLSVLHNYFDGPTKLFSNLYLAKFLDISIRPFFLYLEYLEHYFRLRNLTYRCELFHVFLQLIESVELSDNRKISDNSFE